MIENNEVVTIDEAMTSSWLITGNTRRIIFQSSRKCDDPTIRLAGVLARFPERRNVGSIFIDVTSNMTSVEIATFFPNLESLEIGTPAISHIAPLTGLRELRALILRASKGCIVDVDTIQALSLRSLTVTGSYFAIPSALKSDSYLEHLGLIGYTEDNLVKIRMRHIETLVVLGGAIATVPILQINKIDNIRFGRCVKLKNLCALSAKSVKVSQCNQLDLDTLGHINELKSITLRAPKQLASLAFLGRCKDLEFITITAAKLKNVDLSDLAKIKKLKAAWLTNGVSDQDVLRLSKAIGNSCLSNGVTYVRAGIVIDSAEFFRTME